MKLLNVMAASAALAACGVAHAGDLVPTGLRGVNLGATLEEVRALPMTGSGGIPLVMLCSNDTIVQTEDGFQNSYLHLRILITPAEVKSGVVNCGYFNANSPGLASSPVIGNVPGGNILYRFAPDAHGIHRLFDINFNAPGDGGSVSVSKDDFDTVLSGLTEKFGPPRDKRESGAFWSRPDGIIGLYWTEKTSEQGAQLGLDIMDIDVAMRANGQSANPRDTL
jgi:hypothetical protein